MKRREIIFKIIPIIIIMIMGIFLYKAKTKIIFEAITKVSFYIEADKKDSLLNFYKEKFSRALSENKINIYVSRNKINFVVLKQNEAMNILLKDMIDKRPVNLNLSEYHSKTNIDPTYVYLLTIFFILIPISYIWWYKVMQKEEKFQNVNFSNIFRYSAILLLGFSFFNYLIALIIELNGYSLMNYNPQGLNEFITGNLLSSFLVIVIIAPITEELLFRGLFFRFFLNKNMVFLGALIISVEFAISHYYILELNLPIQMKIFVMVKLFILSILLCWVYKKFNTILAPIILHGLNNLIAFVLTIIYL